MKMEKDDDIEQLLKRMEELQVAHDRLKQDIINRRTLTESHYFNILQSIEEPIYITDRNGCLVYRNPAWEKFYGYSGAESLGKSIVELTVGAADATIATNILEQILKGAVHGGEFVVRNNKGQRFLSFGFSNPLRDQNYKIIGMLGVSTFPTPFPEITPHPIPKVKPPKKQQQQQQQLITESNGISWPWKGNERKGGRSCWHWLSHVDQDYDYLLKMMPPPANTLAQSFDKLYEIKWEDLIIKECLGRASYGILYHAEWYGSDVGLKLYHKQQHSHDLILSFKQEVSVMKRLRHPNILLFMGTVISPHHVCIVTEFLCRGSLFQLLGLRRGRINMKHRVHMALDIARGMNYLHCCLPPIIHCDLKSSNLRVDKNWRVKISDFGLCRPKHQTKEGIGTPEWMAPEVLRNEEADEKSDVYSYGVVLWEMTTEKIPWDGLTSIQVIKDVGFMNQRLDLPKDVDPQWASLIDRCLCSEPDSRPTFQDILDELKELQTNINIALQLHATNNNKK